jgi:hypothetical protein
MVNEDNTEDDTDVTRTGRETLAAADDGDGGGRNDGGGAGSNGDDKIDDTDDDEDDADAEGAIANDPTAAAATAGTPKRAPQGPGVATRTRSSASSKVSLRRSTTVGLANKRASIARAEAKQDRAAERAAERVADEWRATRRAEYLVEDDRLAIRRAKYTEEIAITKKEEARLEKARLALRAARAAEDSEQVRRDERAASDAAEGEARARKRAYQGDLEKLQKEFNELKGKGPAGLVKMRVRLSTLAHTGESAVEYMGTGLLSPKAQSAASRSPQVSPHSPRQGALTPTTRPTTWTSPPMTGARGSNAVLPTQDCRTTSCSRQAATR